MGAAELDLNIVFGTYNRLRYLAPCLESARRACGGRSGEFIVVDGGSTDGTLEYLRKQKDVTLVEHGELRGCVKAYNDGFARARARYVAYLNDDLVVEGRALEAACLVLDDDPEIGLVSIPYRNGPQGAPAVPYMKAGGQRLLFASFGVLRRELGEAAGWFDGYYHYYGDCHLAMSIYAAGYEVRPLHGQLITHYAADNAVRGAERWDAGNGAGERARQDGARFQEVWGERNG